ncbi:MAG: hypothetical protein DSM107014_00045 [Gomphosphaeria aponina SAG 52.96 = DSM 107014]|uniref:Uncharacterized protein n=1 Tax=Gomphosphaeria aponina SAG 52.96 = DSM 107014 TaxID=1521640 RepID=A0A941GSL9_9CHRO|nr:hypothetical protein [Gomphosphaeria aponina SAG 52.96 = DSM 107014]
MTATILSAAALFAAVPLKKATAFSVCGLQGEEAYFKTDSYLITICLGEASYQMIITYHDGTGYQRIPAQREGALFRGSDSQHNYIIDSNTFVIGTDGEPPIRERVIKSQN